MLIARILIRFSAFLGHLRPGKLRLWHSDPDPHFPVQVQYFPCYQSVGSVGMSLCLNVFC